MRLLMTNLFATALVLFGASTASAFSSAMTTSYNGTDVLGVGDFVDVEIFFDATAPGVQFYTVGVLWDANVFDYVPQSNASVGVPTYVLYGVIGAGMTAMNTSLVPLQDPWIQWAGATPPGKEQVNIAWYDPSFAGAGGTGLVKLGEIRLVVTGLGSGTGDVSISNTTGGSILQVFDAQVANPVSGDFAVITPEPTTAVLEGLGLLGLGVAGRRRA